MALRKKKNQRLCEEEEEETATERERERERLAGERESSVFLKKITRGITGFSPQVLGAPAKMLGAPSSTLKSFFSIPNISSIGLI